MRTIRLASLCGLAALAAVLLGAGSREASAKGGRLSLQELASIRGADTPPTGCAESKVQKTCINPKGDQYSSDCPACKWVRSMTVQNPGKPVPPPSYQDPGDPCSSPNGTAYSNKTYVVCKPPKVANDLVCNKGTLSCWWACACNSGKMVQDVICDTNKGSPFTCSVNKPPQTQTLPSGTIVRWYWSCRACTTGASTAPPKLDVEIGACIE
jgi:hypothetical protein